MIRSRILDTLTRKIPRFPGTHHNSVCPALLLTATLALAIGTLIPPATAATPGGPLIPHGPKAHGQAALDRLGDKLPDVARAHGKTPEELRAIFKRDPMLWLGEYGSLNYICEMAPLDAAAEAGFGADAGAQETLPLEQTFFLHSRPGATKVIYLDFDGHITSGLHWNINYNNGQDIVTPPFDIDGIPSGFSAAELAKIQFIWDSVSEDFAPFDVDVTTEDPGVEALRKTSSGDNFYGIRACIGGNGLWYGGGGGVANLRSFIKDTDTPCFIFAANFGGNEKYISDATGHEVGHTLGLSHDGITGGTAYYTGHGDWAPIMGLSYYVNVGQWSKGEYPNANNTEDDLAVMQNNGIAYRSDDHGNWMADATPLYGSVVSASGVVETRSDVDMFSFQTGGGLVEFSVTGPSPSPNLDIMLGLYNGSGNLVAYADPSGLASTLTTSLASGTYYLSVEGVGAGDLSTGYSDYASIGEYVLTGSITDGGSFQAPVASATATPSSGVAPLTVSLSSVGSYDPDGSITSYDWEFGDGGSTASPNPVHVYNNPGTYSALLIVTDNDGLSANNSVTIVVTEPANVAPIASISAGASSGYAPVTIAFSGTGSYDTDGSIVGYSWNFGDGGTSTSATPSHTFNSIGSYTVRLTVTDDRGGTGSATTTINVLQNPNAVVFVQSITVSIQKKGKNSSAEALVKIVDQNGNPTSNATVTGTWSGVVSGSSSGITDASGQARMASDNVRGSGSFVFTVTSVSASGYNYDASRNVETTDSATDSTSSTDGGSTGGGGKGNGRK